MLQGELLISWVSGLDRVEEQPWMGEVVSLTIVMTIMMTMMMTTTLSGTYWSNQKTKQQTYFTINLHAGNL